MLSPTELVVSSSDGRDHGLSPNQQPPPPPPPPPVPTTPSPTNNNNTFPASSSGCNLDHYKYLRTLLPGVGYSVESLNFSHEQQWQCCINVSVLTKEERQKWMADFQKTTSTRWITTDKGGEASSGGPATLTTYRCVPPSPLGATSAPCPAQVQMQLQTSSVGARPAKRQSNYSCTIKIDFNHNHELCSPTESAAGGSGRESTTQAVSNAFGQPLTAGASASQLVYEPDLEGFFLSETGSRASSAHTTTTLQSALGQLTPSEPGVEQSSFQVNPASVQPPPPGTPHTAPQGQTLSTTFSTVSAAPLNMDEPLQLMIQPLPPPPPYGIAELEKKLEDFCRSMKKRLVSQSESSSKAIKQFIDAYESIKYQPEALDKALTEFGGGAMPAAAVVAPTTTMTATTTLPAATVSAVPSTVAVNQIANGSSAPVVVSQWDGQKTYPVVSIVTPPVPPSSSEVTTPDSGKKVKKKRAKDASADKVLPGQIDPITGKRKKRTRCGTCQGCINRDRTQDCRECRNCRDQKRYGGPGRLKKACVKRSCVIMATSESQAQVLAQAQSQSVDLAHGPDTNTSSSLLQTLSLPLSPVPVSTAAQSPTSDSTSTTATSMSSATTTSAASLNYSRSISQDEVPTTGTIDKKDAAAPVSTIHLAWSSTASNVSQQQQQQQQTTTDQTLEFASPTVQFQYEPVPDATPTLDSPNSSMNLDFFRM